MKPISSYLAAATLLAGVHAVAFAADPAPAYQPLAFLVGHCWRGTFPDGKVTDEHCFSWVYGGKFVRDQHVVHRGAGQADDLGESIYLWDAAAEAAAVPVHRECRRLQPRHGLSAEGEALVFPPTHYLENGAEQTYRSRWQRSGDRAYEVVTEFLVKGRWTPGFTVHMQQVERRRLRVARLSRPAGPCRAPDAPPRAAATPGAAPGCSCRTAIRSDPPPARAVGCGRRTPG